MRNTYTATTTVRQRRHAMQCFHIQINHHWMEYIFLASSCFANIPLRFTIGQQCGFFESTRRSRNVCDGFGGGEERGEAGVVGKGGWMRLNGIACGVSLVAFAQPALGSMGERQHNGASPKWVSVCSLIRCSKWLGFVRQEILCLVSLSLCLCV